MPNLCISFIRRLTTISRASEWWGYKLSPLAATAYATASLAGSSLSSLWFPFLLLLLSLAVGALYVSIVNDWTDIDIDRAAGKHNRLADTSPALVRTYLAVCLVPGLFFGVYFWLLDPIISGCYLGAWVSYSAYSLPPIRLKIRGFAGVLADAAGAHLFPQLFIVALLGHAGGGSIPVAWWTTVGIWALACGIRNILWHQLSDVAADRKAGVHTFVTSVGENRAQRLGERMLFPVEVLSFGLMLLVLNQVVPVLFLVLYALLELFRWRIWRLSPLVLTANKRIILNEYYSLFFPLSLLLSQSLRVLPDTPFLLLHVLLFSQHGQQTWRDCVQLVRLMAGKQLRRVRWVRIRKLK